MEILYSISQLAMRLTLNLIFYLPEIFSYVDWRKRKGEA